MEMVTGSMVAGSMVTESEEELMSHGRRTERESTKNGQMERSLDPAEEEAIRVMEIGEVIGFDFSCEEEELLNEITRREKEDDDRGGPKAG
ncbi:hypothetical protein Q3G72_017222 [Acer saccharum]|nr:hypothetical protein Q3G72_017222 [Acer saccharum]